MPPAKTKFWSLRGYRMKQFVRHFLACDLDEVEAAARANFPNPEKDGPRLLRRKDIQEAIEEVGKDIHMNTAMGPVETKRLMAAIARNKDHPNQFKAIEVIGRWNGLNVDKTTLHLDPTALLEAVEKELKQIKAPDVVEAELVQKALPVAE